MGVAQGSTAGDYFYPRSPYGERPWGAAPPSPPKAISIHALLTESDAPNRRPCHYNNISIHALLTESDLVQIIISGYARDFYPRSPYGERLTGFFPTLEGHKISIHALLTESDRFCPTCQWRRSVISIHALLTESDQLPGELHRTEQNFYPRSPYGERLACFGRL